MANKFYEEVALILECAAKVMRHDDELSDAAIEKAWRAADRLFAIVGATPDGGPKSDSAMELLMSCEECEGAKDVPRIIEALSEFVRLNGAS